GRGKQFIDPGVRGMAFDNNGTTGGEGRSGVAATDAEGEGEIGSPEDNDGAPRNYHSPQVGFGLGRALRIGSVDSGIDPRALAHNLGEHFQLAGGAGALTDETRFGQTRLSLAAVDEIVAEAHDEFGDGVE